MDCRLTEHIKHSCSYNPGGIAHLYLLDFRGFQNYRFSGDQIFMSGYVDEINSDTMFAEVDCSDSTSFSETGEDGLYMQSLQTFINTQDANKLSILLRASSGKYIVAFSDLLGRMFCFGSDGGATLSFDQKVGQIGEGAGYLMTLSKQSIYPLFELNPDTFNKIEIINILGTEDARIVTTEDFNNIITIKRHG